MRDEILYMIQRYENKIRGLEASIEEADGTERDMLIGRKEAFRLEMIKDLKRLLELVPEPKTATILMKFPGDDEEYEYGTYAFNTAAEKNSVNEKAMMVRRERECQVEVRVNE